ncbi:MAG TPA: Wzz/FepE/Etk N-terminal domain-containing protein, partial [Candidatus Manganitrophaceae bacterium]|nr:Wzz/FepE/Etk N-terminal domain-containing protein [Candidatus Manganitrophaceae bacterium]
MKQDNEQLLRDYIGILWRQKIWIVIPTVAGILVSIFLALYLPKIYRSTTLILVEAQKVPEEYVKSAVSGTVEGRLSTIQQQILSRSLLQKIIDRFDLYQREQKGTAVEEIIERMRGNIEVKTVGTRNNIDAFSISYEGKDPETVMKVTNELASLFIEENLKIREQLVEGTSEFLDNELNSLKTVLEEQENKIGEFKRAYMGELPQQLEPNLRALDRFQADLQSIQLAKKMAEDRKLMVEKTIEIMKRQMAGVNGPGAQQDLTPGTTFSPLMVKLAQKRELLANLQMEYKESYPDIIMLKREIQEIENQIGLTESGDSLDGEKSGKAIELTPGYLADLQKQLRDAEIELRGLRNREKAIEKQIKVYEHRVENVPAREQILLTLVRDYD